MTETSRDVCYIYSLNPQYNDYNCPQQDASEQRQQGDAMVGEAQRI